MAEMADYIGQMLKSDLKANLNIDLYNQLIRLVMPKNSPNWSEKVHMN